MAGQGGIQTEGQIAIIMADLADYTRGEVIALGLNINANLRSNPPLGTPIDLGWASANWVPSVGAPAFLPSDKKEPTAGDVSARAQVADKGTNEVLSWRPEDGPIFSTNSVPYIEPLNAGHSPQSPRGFVQVAIEKAIRQTYSRAASQGARNRRAAGARATKPRPKR